MSDPTTPERDAHGRFVKPPEAPPPRMPGESDMHPAARVMFGWVSAKWLPNLLLLIVALVSLALVLIDLRVERQEFFGMADATGFYALWGFGSFALAVLSGWPLARLLRREADYYGEGDTTPQNVTREGEE